jgi:hypothetical protein
MNQATGTYVVYTYMYMQMKQKFYEIISLLFVFHSDSFYSVMFFLKYCWLELSKLFATY